MSGPAPGYMRRTATTAVLNSVVSALAVVFLLPFVIRSVGLSTYGIWSILNLFVGLASLLDCGVSKALIYEIRRRNIPAAELLATALLMAGIVSAATGLALAMALYFGWSVFGPAVMQVSGLCWWLGACGVLVLFAQLSTTLLRSVLEANYRSDLVNVGFTVLTLLYYGTAALVARSTSDPKAMVAGSASVYVLMLMATFGLVALMAQDGLRRPSMRASRSLLRYGIRVFMLELPTMALVPMLQFGLQRTASDGRQYGLFELAYRISNLAASTLASISAPFFALVAGASAGEAVAIRSRVGRQVKLSLALAAAGWVTFLAIGHDALRLVFGIQDPELFRIALFLLCGQALLGSVEPITRMLMGLGRLRGLMLARLAMLVASLSVALFYQWLPVLDRYAIGLAIGYALGALITVDLNRREKWGRPQVP